MMDLPADINYSVVAHAASYHFDRSEDFNERNAGLGLRARKQDWQYMVGGYKNSLGKSTIYAGVGKILWEKGPVSFALLGILATGYRYPLVPAVVPELEVKLGSVSLLINYLPPLPSSPQVVALSFMKRF